MSTTERSSTSSVHLVVPRRLRLLALAVALDVAMLAALAASSANGPLPGPAVADAIPLIPQLPELPELPKIPEIPTCPPACIVIEAPVILDTDGDGVPNFTDNCPAVANATQLNTDGAADGGDACDSLVDGVVGVLDLAA